MNPLDWIAVGMFVLTLVGMQITPPIGAHQQRATTAQVQGMAEKGEADLALGGVDVCRFANSGQITADERAIAARQALAIAIGRYDLPKHYHGFGLRVGGSGDLAEIDYFDSRLFYVSAADAHLNGAASAHDLAAHWRDGLDAAIRALPSPVPDGWLATTGAPSGQVHVSDALLADAVSCSLSQPAVSARVDGGIVTLVGQVPDALTRQRVVSLVEQLPGVQGVVDQLQVSR
ncbi:MAG TPA: BON domain-containing protein [Oscillatoriaceae cyanobacterium]